MPNISVVNVTITEADLIWLGDNYPDEYAAFLHALLTLKQALETKPTVH